MKLQVGLCVWHGEDEELSSDAFCFLSKVDAELAIEDDVGERQVGLKFEQNEEGLKIILGGNRKISIDQKNMVELQAVLRAFFEVEGQEFIM